MRDAGAVAFDVSERGIWRGSGDAYGRTFARLCAELAPALLDAAGVTGVTGVTGGTGGTGARRRVLDVGTGTGTVASLAVRRGAAVVACDAEPSMVAVAAREVPEAETVVAALPALPFPDGAFDAAVAGFVLNHVGRPAAAAAELRRVVRPGGRVAVTIWAAPPAAGQTLVGRAFAAAGVARPSALVSLDPADDFPRTPDGLVAILRGAGLTDVTCERVEWVHRATPDAWWDGPASGVATVGRTLAAQPPDVRRRARASFDELAAGLAGPDGLLDLPHAALLAVGAA